MVEYKIGFIGLGMMGSAMVECLQKKEYSVTVLGNKNRTPIDTAIARGATEVSTAKELAECSNVIMLCMGTSDHVEGRMYGDDGVISGLQKDTVVIDFGTSLPASTKKIGADVAAQGATYLDAPLGRTPAHAMDGLLNIMCSGNESAFERVRPLLEDLGENVFHLGALGTGHSIKLINNFFGMTLVSAMCEAFSMADKVGVDREQLYSVMSSGPLHSMMMDFVKAYAVDADLSKLEFSIKNARKDVNYFKSMAEEVEFTGMVYPATVKTFDAAAQAGFGESNVPAILDYLQQLND